MPTKRMDIDVTTRAQTSEAAKAEQALDRVNAKTKEATAATKANAAALTETGTKAQSTNDVIEGLAASTAGGTGAIGGMTRALRGMAGVLGLSGPLGLVAGAIAAVGTAAALIVQKVNAGKQEIKDMGDAAIEAAPKLSELDKVKLNFADEIDALAKLREGLDAGTNAANDQFAAMQRLKDAATALDLQKIAVAEAEALAGTQDPAKRERLKLNFARERMGVTQRRERERAAETVTAEQAKVEQLDNTMAQLTREIERLRAPLFDAVGRATAARTEATRLGIKSNQERDLAEFAELAGMSGEDRSAKQQARFIKLQSLAPAAREQIAAGDEIYKAATEETQRRLERFHKDRRRAYEVVGAEGGLDQDPGPEVREAFEKREAMLLRQLELLQNLPGIVKASQGARETYDTAAGPIQQRLGATQRARGQAATGLQVARIQQATVAQQQRAEYTVQTTAVSDFEADQKAEADKAALRAELKTLKGLKPIVEKPTEAERAARARLSGEAHDVDVAEGVLADFEATNRFNARSMTTSRTRASIHSAIAAERGELEALASGIERLAKDRAANLKALNQRIEQLQGQIENTP